MPTDIADDFSSEGQTSVLVEVTYDRYPEEVGWSLIKGDTILLSRPEGSVTEDEVTVSGQVNLDPGEYTFVITDSESDGICCEYGNGSWEIRAELDGVESILAEGDGNHGAGTNETFIIP